MNLIQQTIIAARGKNVEEWMNILFVVAVAIFWVVGGIFKAKANKAKQNQQPGAKPGLKPQRPSEVAKGLQQQRQVLQQSRHPFDLAQRKEPAPAVQPARRKVTRPQPVVPKLELAAKIEPFVKLKGIEPLEDKYIGDSAESQPEYLVEPLIEPFVKLKGIEPLEDKYIGDSAESQPEHLVEPLLDYADPDKLKRAILHCEILGKPLSLRSPSEHIIGLG